MTICVDMARIVKYNAITQNVKGVKRNVKNELAGAKMRELRGGRPAKVVAEELGISESALLMYERGDRNPRDDIKVRIARYYGVGVGDIFYPGVFTKCEE